MTMVPGPEQVPDRAQEIEAKHGTAYANWQPYARWPDTQVGLVVAGQKVACTPEQAADALAVLTQLFGPLAETQRAAARAARPGEIGGGRDAA